MPNNRILTNAHAPVNSQTNLWTPREVYLLALVCLLSGLMAGYLFHGSAPATMSTAVSASTPAAAAPVPTTNDLAPLTAPLLSALKVNPKDGAALIQLANIYYDHQIFPEAIEYYTRALQIEPKNINVRTDLGTAYWYSGFPEKAVVEYEKSLAVDPMHVNTLFNMGVVRLEGLKDAPGASKYFEKVLALNASPQQREKAQELLTKARSLRP